jgi:hypothetical protein
MKARLIKHGQITKQSNRQAMRQHSHSQSAAQAPALTGIAAIRVEVQARMTTSERQKREQARKNFNDLFAQGQ